MRLGGVRRRRVLSNRRIEQTAAACAGVQTRIGVSGGCSSSAICYTEVRVRHAGRD